MKISSWSLCSGLWMIPSTAAFAPRHQRRATTMTRPMSPLFSQVQDNVDTAFNTTSRKEDDDGAAAWIANGLNQQEEEDEVTVGASDYIHPLQEAQQTSSAIIGPSRIAVFDTTLRDGTQGESVSASVSDKLKIAQKLASMNIDYIEAGWPGSNPKDAEFFEQAKTLPESVRSKLVAFGSTRRKNIAVEQDGQIQALVDSQVPTVCLVAKAHQWQVTEILRATPEENLQMIRDSVEYLVSLGKTVLVDLEHFLDGYQAFPEYALECAQVAAEAGAACLVLCDTNGGSMPWQVEEISKVMVERFGKPNEENGGRTTTIGIHCHNDCGMAVANSVCGAHAGVGLVQGTINGLGERTGNADLTSILPSLALHVNTQMTCRDQLPDLTNLSRFVDELLNRTPNPAAPFVGASAFAHKGGLHVAAMERNPLSYQHIEPELVGNQMRVLISELSGRQNILGKMKEMYGEEDAADSEGSRQMSDRALAILNHVKNLEHQGYTFEGAEASVHLMILHATRGYCPPFQVLDYSAQVYDHNMDSASRVVANFDNDHTPQQPSRSSSSRATVKVRTIVENTETYQLEFQDMLEVSDGNGPVDSLAKALLRALSPAYPHLESAVELIDYKVRILDPASATGAATRVMIEFRDQIAETQWTTVSVDTNVISASLNALVDGFEYALIEHAHSCMLCDDAFE